MKKQLVILLLATITSVGWFGIASAQVTKQTMLKSLAENRKAVEAMDTYMSDDMAYRPAGDWFSKPETSIRAPGKGFVPLLRWGIMILESAAGPHENFKEDWNNLLRDSKTNGGSGICYVPLHEHCAETAELIKNGYLPLVTGYDELARMPGVSDEQISGFLGLSKSFREEAAQLIVDSACPHAGHNIWRALDWIDAHHLANKFNFPDKAWAADEETYFSTSSESVMDLSVKMGSTPAFLMWDIPGCNLTDCRPGVKRIDKDAWDSWYLPHGDAKEGIKKQQDIKGAMPRHLKNLKDTKGYFEKTAERQAEAQKEAALALAQRGSTLSLSLPLSDIKPAAFIGRVIRQLLSIVGALGLAFFVYGGILWMTASGNEERVKKARNTIVWSSLGLVAIFAAYAIVNFIITALTGG